MHLPNDDIFETNPPPYISVLAYSWQLEAQQYSGSYKSNYSGDDSQNPMMSDINYNLTVNGICIQQSMATSLDFLFVKIVRMYMC